MYLFSGSHNSQQMLILILVWMSHWTWKMTWYLLSGAQCYEGASVCESFCHFHIDQSHTVLWRIGNLAMDLCLDSLWQPNRSQTHRIAMHNLHVGFNARTIHISHIISIAYSLYNACSAWYLLQFTQFRQCRQCRWRVRCIQSNHCAQCVRNIQRVQCIQCKQRIQCLQCIQCIQYQVYNVYNEYSVYHGYSVNHIQGIRNG